MSIGSIMRMKIPYPRKGSLWPHASYPLQNIVKGFSLGKLPYNYFKREFLWLTYSYLLNMAHIIFEIFNLLIITSVWLKFILSPQILSLDNASGFSIFPLGTYVDWFFYAILLLAVVREITYFCMSYILILVVSHWTLHW